MQNDRPRGLDVLPPSTLASMGFAECQAAETPVFPGDHFAALADVDLAGELRIVYPGQYLPADTAPDRLNVEVNDAGMILRMFCG